MLGFLFLSSLFVCLGLGSLQVWGQIPTPILSPRVQQGITRYNSGNFQGAIALWESAIDEASDPQSTVLQYLARAYQQVGQIDRAIACFDLALDNFRQAGNLVQVERILTEQAQAYSLLGQHRRAISILCGEGGDGVCKPDSALEIARSQGDETGVVAALGSLGNTYRLQGEYTRARQYLEESLEQAKRLDRPSYRMAALNSLGNLCSSLAKRDYRYAEFASQGQDEIATQDFRQKAKSHDEMAVQYFLEMLQLARGQNDPQAELGAILNLVMPLHRWSSSQFLGSSDRLGGFEAKEAISEDELLPRAVTLLEGLPNSRETAYAAIELANLRQIVQLDSILFEAKASTQCLRANADYQVIELLDRAVAIAQQIGDLQAQSWALGRLGHLYECQRDQEKAIQLTQQAQFYAVTPSSRYLWEWQIGRILKAQGRELEAIDAYEQSIASLDRIRGDIAVASREFQLDFRDTIEPVYRQLAELRLEQVEHFTLEPEIQVNLKAAVNTLEQLRLAELQNYLGNECDLVETDGAIPLSDPDTAVFASILFPDRIAVILTLPEGDGGSQWRLHWIPVSRTEAIETVNDFRFNLEKRSDRSNRYQDGAMQLYDWFVRPFAADLAAAEIKTLVFLQDGILRSIPMAVLYDGEQFLLEQYAIAITPTLAINRGDPVNLEELRVLAFGVSAQSAIDPQTVFPALENVRSEIESIQETLPESKGLLDEAFTRHRLQEELDTQAYPILHLATHAQFGIDSRNTFLVTGELMEGSNLQGYNATLTLNQLDQLIKNTETELELLTLTACETAVGNDRDALGLAGVALQAGVRTAIATLWQVDDRSTAEMIARFYQHLREGLSKASALQATQKDWLAKYPSGSYHHPAYWAPFVLIGSWL